MGTAEVFELVGAFVLVAGGIIGGMTAGIAYKYRTEIKRAEENRAMMNLRAVHGARRRRGANAPEETSKAVELAGVGR